MDIRSKILAIAVVLIIAGVTAWKYDAFVTQHDFMVYDQVSCDSTVESCFTYICEEGDEECDDTHYKKIEKSARNITLCPNYEEGSCPELSCAEGEEDCEITYCSDDSLEEGEECVEIEEAEEEIVSDMEEGESGEQTDL